jgi:hypothetical protein
MTQRRYFDDRINDSDVTPPDSLTAATGYVLSGADGQTEEVIMRIRQALAVGLAAVATPCAIAQSVVDLPGVHAAANAGCVEPAGAASTGLSYACLNRLMAADTVPASTPVIDARVDRRPTNTLGLYNAAGLQHRMGPNLGVSVQPYRPKLTYPAPLVGPAR